MAPPRDAAVTTGRGTVGRCALLVVLLVTSVAWNAPSAAAAPPPAIAALPRSTPDLDTLTARADALRSELEGLQARAEWTQERLAQARDALASATVSAVEADQQLAALQGATTEAEVDLAHRVRAIEQSGGAAALYSQAIDASTLTDVASNVAALDAVLSTDVVNVEDAAQAQLLMDQVHARLDRLADERARLVTEAHRLADRARRLVSAQRALLRDADAQVARLTLALERREARREAAAAAAVSPWTGALPAGPTPYATEAVANALSVLGSPYVWGDEGPSTFDCSGLVQWSYLQAGLVLPRLASDQYFASTPVPADTMQPGDLLVYAYDTSDPDTIHHIAMYIGDGQMVHAPRTGDVVRVVPVYYEGLYGVGRPGL